MAVVPVAITSVLLSVSFGNGRDITVDGSATGETYSAPHWTSTRRYPYLIQEGVTLKVSAAVRIVGPITSDPRIRGINVDDMNVAYPDGVVFSVHDGDVYGFDNIELDAPFSSSVTAFYDTFQIYWELSLDDGSTWNPVGISSNALYVCLADPTPTPPPTTMFYTVVHLACANGGANAATAFDHTWDFFTDGANPPGPRNVTTWNGTSLYYYQPGTDLDANSAGTILALLQDGTGNCYAWAKLLEAALTVNGVSFTKKQATMHAMSTSNAFFVKAWSSLGSSFFFNNTNDPPEPDMLPYPAGSPPAGGRYGYYDNGGGTHFKNDQTVAGQGTGSDAPSEKVFGIHRFTQVGGVYFDASYGCEYSSDTNFQTHLAGHGRALATSPIEVQFSTVFSSPDVIVFSNAPS